MTDLQIFQNDDFGQIRTIEMDSVIWFIAVDVCSALDLGNVTNTVKRLDDDEHALISVKGISKGNDKTNCVSESGLYSMILGSRKPEAKAFKRWVTHEVIPAIRKTGNYTVQPPQAELPARIEIKRKKQADSKAPIIRLDGEAFGLIEKLSYETGRPLAQIASELIIKAAPFVQITD